MRKQKGLFDAVVATFQKDDTMLSADQEHHPSTSWSVCVGEDNHHRIVLLIVVGP